MRCAGSSRRHPAQNQYQFLQQAAAPPTVNPSLWRLAQLNALNGLFKIADGVYQVRGFSLANMTIVEGATGVIVVDPLLDGRVGARGDRPVLSAPAETARGRRDLHPQPPRPLRRRQRCHERRGRRERTHEGARARRLHGRRRPGNGDRRQRHVAGARSTSSADRCRAASGATSTRGWARTTTAARRTARRSSRRPTPSTQAIETPDD